MLWKSQRFSRVVPGYGQGLKDETKVCWGLLSEPRLNRDRSTRHRETLWAHVTVMAHRVPAPSFLAGERVEAVVLDDVEAALALHDVGHRMTVDHFGTNPKSSTTATVAG